MTLLAVAMLLLQGLVATAALHRGPLADIGAFSLADASETPCVGGGYTDNAPAPWRHIDHADCCLNCLQRVLTITRIGVDISSDLAVFEHRTFGARHRSRDDGFRPLPGWTTSWSSRAPPRA